MGNQRYGKVSEVDEYLCKAITAAQVATQVDAGTHGHFLGRVNVNTPGTTTVVTLTNGDPGAGGAHIATITVPSGFIGSLPFGAVCDNGLWITATGSGMDVSVMYLDEVI